MVTHNGLSQQQLLELAAQAESHSTHPVAQSIRQAYGQTIDAAGIQAYEELPDYGIRARVNGQTVLAGSDRLLHQAPIPHDVCVVEGTVAHIVVDGQYGGRILIADELKADAVKAVHALQMQHIQTVMLTGDSASVAAGIAQQLGLDDYRAELLPEGKVAALEALLHRPQSTHQKVAFVGDGINDAPVIARADVGIAMGGLGSDAAIETADVVIMTDAPATRAVGDLDHPPHASHRLAKHCAGVRG